MELAESIRVACAPHAHRIHENIRITCPACSHSRKKANRRDPCLVVLIKDDRFVYECKHCEISGCIPLEEKVLRKPLPPADIKKALDGDLTGVPLDYLTKERKINPDILKQFGVFSTTRYFPKLEKEVKAIGFPYFEGERVYATKFRAVDAKAHTQDGGGASTFFGQHLVNGGTTLCVCEGEIDSLSLASAGVTAVSVPNGAPSKISSDRRIDPAEDRKFAYVWQARELFSRMEKVILCCDADTQGEALAEELARRIGKDKCWIVLWPTDCKDANDVLVKHGPEKLKETIESATPYPLSGLNNASFYSAEVDALYRHGVAQGLSTGFSTLDDLFTIKTGFVSVVTGVPSSGKSNFIDSIMVRLAKKHDWKFALSSFENDPSTHITQLIEKYSGRSFFESEAPRLTESQLRESKQFVDDHFVFIDNNEGQKVTLENILEKSRAAVSRMGIRGLVIDPFSYIALPNKDKSETQQIGDMLTDVRMFAKLHDIHVWFVAHPAKMIREKGTTPIPRGYDLSGSAHWYNFADLGISLSRFFDTDRNCERVKVICWKSRYRWMGSHGERILDYDITNGDYFEEEKEVPEWAEKEQWWDT